MKVLFLNPWDRRIGPNRYLVEMLRHAPELASQATVVFHETNDAMEEYKNLGCRIATWPEIALIHPHLTVRNVVDLIFTHSMGLTRVIRRLRTLRPELVVSNTENLWVAGIAARLVGIPHIQVVHSLAFEYRWNPIAPLVRLYVRWLSLFVSRFVAVSNAVRRMLANYGVKESKIMVVPNGFDVRAIREKSELPLPLDLERLIYGRNPILISVGRVAPMKGQDVLIEAIRRIREHYPSLLCLIVGRLGSDSGVENISRFYSNLINKIYTNRIQDHVYFLDETDYLPELFHRADIYIHPSLTESFSRVVAEAIICGKPVVCTNVGALPEIVGFQGALLVPPGRAEALAEGVISVLNEGSLRDRIVLSGQVFVENNYRISITTQRFLNALTYTINKKVRNHG